jgi:alanine-glyoxylate transaminase / serine-glyoxylate transaminase / serine-pyruvate transaminase
MSYRSWIMQSKLLIPGPVDIDDDVLQALGGAVTPHYGLDWGVMHTETVAGLRKIFRTSGAVYVIPGSGSAGTDAALGNLLAPGQRVLVCANGYFGNRLTDIAEGYGAEVVQVDAAWGTAIDVQAVRAAFERSGPIDALAIVHVETSTGVINPIREIAAVAQEYGAAVVVDAITGLGGAELDVDGWGIDICISATQKSLAAPAGLALVAVSDRGWARINARVQAHGPVKIGWYSDSKHWRDYAEEVPAFHPHPVTMPPGNVRALHLQVKKILALGLDAYIARHANAAARFRAGLAERGLKMYVTGAAAAPMLTIVALPEGSDQRGLIMRLRTEHGLLCSGGFGDLDGKVIRIGHMGKAAGDDYVDAALAGLAAVLARPEHAPAAG